MIRSSHVTPICTSIEIMLLKIHVVFIIWMFRKKMFAWWSQLHKNIIYSENMNLKNAIDNSCKMLLLIFTTCTLRSSDKNVDI